MEAIMERERLPEKRKSVTFELKIDKSVVQFTIGLYEDGRPGEIFIDMHKTGTAARAWLGASAKLMSLMLQYGIPLHELVDAMVGHRSEPFGDVPVEGHPLVKTTCGVLDAIVRIMAMEFLAAEYHRNLEEEDEPCY